MIISSLILAVLLLYILNCFQKQEIERLNKGLDELEELCKTKYYEKNTTNIDSIAIAGNLYVYMYKKIKELKGEDKE